MSTAPLPELNLLGELFRLGDPAPRRAIASAYRAVERFRGGRSPNARLVPLSDTADRPESSPGSDADAEGPRVLTLGAPGRVVELELVGTGPGLFSAAGVVLGRTGQSQAGGVLSVRHGAGESHDVLDHCGGFLVRGIAAGPVSVLLRSRWGFSVATDWFTC
ncbi:MULTISPECIES: hypothetical protein [unclassified Actinopolyspora]|uniref:hypothetical protein n=1 Tax=unclassified Actinopolyspora TaxID=2639451 RepID=UPI0013F6837C|nr:MULTISPECIES: hypothetical protein [unclassified Actinopolyspora]NHD16456.1 hypothetical protein [Actinopolyspora sp. BKK2]NHE75681.1 hypothetical protein [Actinopolyspora sp. BKK1]